MSGRLATPVTLVALVLAAALAAAVSRPRPAACAEVEVIRGTVEKIRPGILSLTDVKLPNGGSAGRPVMVILNKDTEYFHGAARATKESLAAGDLVLVKCAPAGGGRVGILVRIIGGPAR